MLDTPVDYDSLSAAGSIMGSGGMVVMDEQHLHGRFRPLFPRFRPDRNPAASASPAGWAPSRCWTILEDITKGKGTPDDIDLLAELAEGVKKGSLCGLGQTAPNPVLTTLRYFRDEYEAHVNEHRCPAGVCRALIRYLIDAEKCTGCGACRRACPPTAPSPAKEKRLHTIDQEICTRCGICRDTCRFDAVTVH